MLGNFSHFDGEGCEGVSDQMCGGSPDEIMRVEKVLVDVGQTPLCQGYILVVGGEHLPTLTKVTIAITITTVLVVATL